MNSTNSIISLEKADREGIGNKARNLALLLARNPTLFKIPSGLVLLPSFSIQDDASNLKEAIKGLGNGAFAVRSCGLEEDGENQSMAGKFYTKLFVETRNILAAVVEVRNSFGDSVNTCSVLIQHMVEPDFAGVVFSRSPENKGLAKCEYTKGTAEAVVSGKTEPKQVDYGRWSGKLYPEQHEMSDMLSLVFLVAMTIEEVMGVPQDIEWAYNTVRKQLYIVQTRAITSTVYAPYVAGEQDRLAKLAMTLKNSSNGRTLFQNAAVSEVVSSPTRLTQSLIEKLYSPNGALGRAFELIGFPCPKVNMPYVISAFGKLYANLEMENKLFGFSIRRFLTTVRLKRKLKANPQAKLDWLSERIEEFPSYPSAPSQPPETPMDCAREVIAGVKIFIMEVYPVAYCATLLAELRKEEKQGGSVTGQMMSDLSRLHHVGGLDEFLQKWGKRSSNDYELSAPRFCEAHDKTLAYAARFANINWGNGVEGHGFSHLKEVAKDRVIRWLFPLRQRLLALEQVLGLEPGQIFMLDLSDIECLALGTLENNDVRTLCQQRSREQAQWKYIKLGDVITMKELECLTAKADEQEGLRGKMVSNRVSFSGFARLVESKSETHLSGNEILVSKFLEPELVGLFPRSVGCIVDMGGALSHAAIVARELNYPIIVMPGSSKTIRNGDELVVDEHGFVTVMRNGHHPKY